LKQIEKNAWTLVYFFGAARTCILGSRLHFIQITWFTYIFANTRKAHKGFNLQDTA